MLRLHVRVRALSRRGGPGDLLRLVCRRPLRRQHLAELHALSAVPGPASACTRPPARPAAGQSFACTAGAPSLDGDGRTHADGHGLRRGLPGKQQVRLAAKNRPRRRCRQVARHDPSDRRLKSKAAEARCRNVRGRLEPRQQWLLRSHEQVPSVHVHCGFNLVSQPHRRGYHVRVQWLRWGNCHI